MGERTDWKVAVALAARAGVISAETAAELEDMLVGRSAGEPTASEVARWMGVPQASLLAVLTVARTLPAGASDEALRKAVEDHLCALHIVMPSADATPATATPTIPADLDAPESEWTRKTLPLGESSSAQTLAVDAQPMVLGLPKVPKKLGPYALDDELGHGGMGIVYRARHEKLGTPCAVKVLIAGEHASAQAIVRFQREAAAVAKMGKHPNIVNVTDLGQEGSLFYYAMELVEGRSLREVLRERRPSPAETAALMEKVARALHFAHEHGIVHRDVKPDNVLVGANGEPQVTDFGLARDVTSNANLSGTGQLLGTPNYMAPEQVDGVPKAIDARTDVYALGVVLYEMLSGRQAYVGDSAVQVFARILTGEVPSPRSLRPDTPRDLETVCLKAMALEPERRYASAGAFAEDLARYRRGEPVLARPVGWTERMWRRAKRNRAVAVLAVGLCLAVLVALGELAWYAMLPRIRAARAEREERRVRAERKGQAEALLADAKAAESQGRPDDAAKSARALLDGFEGYAAKGEDLPISEAHEVLARVARSRGAARDALVEFYRAYETAVGTPRAAETLARTGEQLFDMDEVERAYGVFERALEERPGGVPAAAGRAEFQARYGIARCGLSTMRLDEARAELLVLAKRPEAEPEERSRIDRLLGVLDLLTPVTTSRPGEFDAFLPADLDGDGKTELVSITDDGRGVVVSRFDGKDFVEAARCRVLGDEPFRLSCLATGDMMGDGKKEVLVAGGDANRKAGAVAALALRTGSLDVIARAPLHATMTGHGLAVAEIDGDKVPEVLVGTGAYERALHVYHLDATARTLKEVGKADLDGDVYAILPRDPGRTGFADVWVFLGPWGAYSISCMRTDRATGQFSLCSSVPFAANGAVDPAARLGDSEEVLACAHWWEAEIAPLREINGRKATEQRYSSPGLYRVRLKGGGKADIAPVWRMDHLEDFGGGSICTFHGKERRYAWGSPPPPVAGRRPAGVCVYEREGDEWRPLFTVHATLGEPVPWDLDGDGGTELLFGRTVTDAGGWHTRHVVIYGLGDRGAVQGPRPVSGGTAPGALRLPRRSSSASLIAAREASRAGLYDEGLAAYARVVGDPPTEEDLEEAALGALDCRTRLGRSAEAAEEARRTIARYPVLKAPLDRALLEAVESAADWEDAGRTAEDLLTVPGLSDDERARLTERVAHLAQLRSPGVAFDAARELPSCDLLSTSPLWAVLAPDGSLRVAASCEGRQGLFVPFAYDRASYRLRATVLAERLDWATGLDIGFFAGDPASTPVGDRSLSTTEAQFGRYPALQTVRLSATGESGSPMRTCDLSAFAAGTGGARRVLDGLVPGEGPLSLTLEYAAHRRWLSCRVERGTQVSTSRLEEAPLEEMRMFLVVGSNGGAAAPDYWARFVVRGLAVDAGSANLRAVAFEPRRAEDFLLLANGRWIQGKADAARALYDRAVAMADLEAAKDAEMRKQGLPSALDTEWAKPYLRWAAVDSRFWRGLLRAESGDAEGAAKDLQAAEDLSAERVHALIAWQGMALADHPRAAAALRRHILAQAGMGEPADLPKFAKTAFDAWGGEVANGLVSDQGLRLRRMPAVAEVQGDGCGLRAGDEVVSWDGKAVPDAAAFRRMQGDALDGERASVRIVCRREGKEAPATIDVRRTRLVVDDHWTLERK